jgi:hypothetical protein
LIPADLLIDADRQASKSIRPLNLTREIERFGRSTRGGVGVSRVLAPSTTASA